MKLPDRVDIVLEPREFFKNKVVIPVHLERDVRESACQYVIPRVSHTLNIEEHVTLWEQPNLIGERRPYELVFNKTVEVGVPMRCSDDAGFYLAVEVKGLSAFIHAANLELPRDVSYDDLEKGRKSVNVRSLKEIERPKMRGGRGLP